MQETARDFVDVQRRFLFQDLPPVIGHRGAALHAPENTLASIREAKAQGARWVEVDVKLSGEGMPFLLHDDTLDRTTDGHGAALGRSIADLQRLDAGGWFASEFAGQSLPRLEALFELLLAENMSVNLEIKPNRGEDAQTVRAAVEAIRDFWPAGRPKPLLSSFSLASVATACDEAPFLPRGLLVDEPGADIFDLIDEFACASLHVDGDHVDPALLEDAVARRIPVLCYTINDPKRAIELLTAGAHSIITDTPRTLIEALLPAQ